MITNEQKKNNKPLVKNGKRHTHKEMLTYKRITSLLLFKNEKKNEKEKICVVHFCSHCVVA